MMSSRGYPWSNSRIRDIILLECSYHSICIPQSMDLSQKVLERGSTLPSQRTVTFSAYRDKSAQVCLRVCEGENIMFKDNSP